MNCLLTFASIHALVFRINDVTYYRAGHAMPVEMDESAIEHVVIPVSGVNAKQITAYAILNKGVPAVALYDCEWYEFVALLAIEYPVWPMYKKIRSNSSFTG